MNSQYLSSQAVFHYNFPLQSLDNFNMKFKIKFQFNGWNSWHEVAEKIYENLAK